MPTTFIGRYKFRFYSSDIAEPPHMHVLDGNKVAKIWLQPVALEYNRGYNGSELNDILKLTRQNQTQLLNTWHEHFNR